jgi:predicted nucleic acid-binding protein
MAAGPFLDSNVLVYAYSSDPRSMAAQAICERAHTLSVQSLNEFAIVARRKLQFDWDEIADNLIAIVDLAETIVPLTFELHQIGIALAGRYRLQVYDAMILAAALKAGCDTVYSEGMQNGMVIEDLLTIRNPFT